MVIRRNIGAVRTNCHKKTIIVAVKKKKKKARKNEYFDKENCGSEENNVTVSRHLWQ